MPSEDNVDDGLFIGYHSELSPNFKDIIDTILYTQNPSWTSGNGMWSWADACLYIQAGQDYLHGIICINILRAE
jgi:hypothetical protein